MASSSSCCALAAPLTPTAPMIWPSTMIGIPPWSGVKSLRVANGSPPLIDHIFEERRGPFEQDCSPRLVNRNVGAGGKGIIQSLKCNEITSFVDDSDGSTGRVLAFCLRDCGGNHFFGALQGESLFLNGLRRPDGREGQRRNHTQRANDELHRFFPKQFRDRFLARLDAKCTRKDAAVTWKGISRAVKRRSRSKTNVRCIT